MVAFISRLLNSPETAEYYLSQQASHRPQTHFTNQPGDDPDGVWWNPDDLFGLKDGSPVTPFEFRALFQGIAPRNPTLQRDPDTGKKLTLSAGRSNRSPGFDVCISPDKTVSALWAVAAEPFQKRLSQAHADAVHTALSLVVHPYCSWTRHRPDPRADLEVIPARIMGAAFQRGTSRTGDPHLRTHVLVYNISRADDGKYRALHPRPLLFWQKTIGAIYRNALAWNVTRNLRLDIEYHRSHNEFWRIRGFPAPLIRLWSRRRQSIQNRDAALPKQHRLRKSSKLQNLRWDFEALEYIGDPDSFIAALPPFTPPEPGDPRITDMERLIDDVPGRLEGAKFPWRYPRFVAEAANATAGLRPPEDALALADKIAADPRIVQLERHNNTPDYRARLHHTRLYALAT
ncbi:MAG: relaxase domain-containing protein [Gemmatimonadetes bacterium]|nr:relaxase domain-containing protein [Gemmatimonadota bacterium]